MADYASEGGRWYKPDGTPMYEIVGKNGALRATTLRDARKLGLLPSVTSIIKEAAAPGLEKWKRDQAILAALTLPRLAEETGEAFLARVQADAAEQGKKAADRGTQIHGALECHMQGRPILHDKEWAIAITNVLHTVCGAQEWAAEKSFAGMGYGGKIDLHSGEWLVDIKTKDGLQTTVLDEHLMQLAAYRAGIGKRRCGILFVDRNAPDAALVEVADEDLDRGLEMFNALLTYHRAKTGHKP